MVLQQEVAILLAYFHFFLDLIQLLIFHLTKGLGLGLLFFNDGLVGVASLITMVFDLVPKLFPELLILHLKLFIFFPESHELLHFIRPVCGQFDQLVLVVQLESCHVSL